MKICSIPCCGREHKARGWCSIHYSRSQRWGDPLKAPRLEETVESRFNEIGWYLEGGCHIWKGYKNKDNYGTFRLNGSMVGAHRVSYLIHVGTIPPGKVIRHRCDNPPCVNPQHLEPGTVKDNVNDSVERGRRAPQDGENNHSAKLTWDDVREIRRLYKETNLSQEKIGKQFGITQVRVSQIVLNKSWVEDF